MVIKSLAQCCDCALLTNVMDSFLSLLCCMKSDDDFVHLDIIVELPPEIAVHILRYLDSASLLSAARVSKKWYYLIRSNPLLKSRVRDHLNEKNETGANRQRFNCKILRGSGASMPVEERNNLRMPKPIPDLSLASERPIFPMKMDHHNTIDISSSRHNNIKDINRIPHVSVDISGSGGSRTHIIPKREPLRDWNQQILLQMCIPEFKLLHCNSASMNRRNGISRRERLPSLNSAGGSAVIVSMPSGEAVMIRSDLM